MTTNTCTCDSIIQGSGGQTATYRILGVLCPTCESAAEAASLPLDEWHDAKSGNASIRLYERGSGADPRNNVYPALPERYAVYALDDGVYAKRLGLLDNDVMSTVI